jgi:hypothetical protein
MFQAPIPAAILLTYGGAQFKDITLEQIDRQMNQYPLNHKLWIEGQKVIQE